MVRALEELAASFSLRDESGAVPAHVRKPSKPGIEIARHDDRLVKKRRREVVAGAGNVFRASHPLPGAPEDPLALALEKRGSRYQLEGMVVAFESFVGS